MERQDADERELIDTADDGSIPVAGFRVPVMESMGVFVCAAVALYGWQIESGRLAIPACVGLVSATLMLGAQIAIECARIRNAAQPEAAGPTEAKAPKIRPEYAS